MLIIPQTLDSILPEDEDPFERIWKLSGTIYRDVPGRRTFCAQLGTKTYFIKFHFGVGWKEILKNVVQLKIPAVDARGEWEVLHRLNQLGIHAPLPVAIGTRGWNPASRQSFLVTEDIGESVNLEEILAHWEGLKIIPVHQLKLKRRLIHAVAHLVKTLHHDGINHRDLYVCHFRIKRSDLKNSQNQGVSPIFLMDLHRAQKRHKTPVRWIAKDLGALLFSCKPYSISLRDQLRFLRGYTGGRLRDELGKQAYLWKRVQRRACRMFEKEGAPQIQANVLSPSSISEFL